MSSPPSRPETILLVDDEHAVRTVVGVMLRRAGYEVILAGSGEEALALFNDHAAEIRLLVSDVKMPGMHGPTLAQRLIGVQPALFVLFMSGYIKVAPSTLRLDHRHVAFLAKPFDAKHLVAKLQELAGSPAGSSAFHPAESAVRTVLDNGRAASGTALIIDPDVVTVDMYARMLRNDGLKVVTAATGDDGLREIANRPPDVILLELRLPDLEGLEVLRRLRRAGTRRAAVAIVTGDYFVDERTVADVKALGAELCFKPLWADDVVAIVRGLLAASALRATS